VTKAQKRASMIWWCAANMQAFRALEAMLFLPALPEISLYFSLFSFLPFSFYETLFMHKSANHRIAPPFCMMILYRAQYCGT
jgi:hypothetical protein